MPEEPKLNGILLNAHRRLTVACAYGYATPYQMETYGEKHYRRVLRDLNDPMWSKPASEIALELALDEILSKDLKNVKTISCNSRRRTKSAARF